MSRYQRSIVAFALAVLGSPAVVARAESPPAQDRTGTPRVDEVAEAQDRPALPPGAVRVVNHARHGSRLAVCAEEPGPPIEQGGRSIPRTRVWVHDGSTMRQVGTAPGTCDPAWSADGARIAVAAPSGLWVLAADLTVTTHLIDTRHRDAPADEVQHRTLSTPKWSPDGSRLAFIVSTGATSWVDVVDARTGEVILSSDPETHEFAWGADSRSLRLGSRVVRLP